MDSQGYLYGRSELGRNSNYNLSYRFVKEYLGLDDSLFSHQDNCYYLSNYHHLEYRGGHRYLRPSKCSKFEYLFLVNRINKKNFTLATEQHKNYVMILNKKIFYLLNIKITY